MKTIVFSVFLSFLVLFSDHFKNNRFKNFKKNESFSNYRKTKQKTIGKRKKRSFKKMKTLTSLYKGASYLKQKCQDITSLKYDLSQLFSSLLSVPCIIYLSWALWQLVGFRWQVDDVWSKYIDIMILIEITLKRDFL